MSQSVKSAFQGIPPDEKEAADPTHEAPLTGDKRVMPLPPPEMSSTLLWKFPRSPPRPHLNSGDLARIARSGKKPDMQVEVAMAIGEPLRRHSYPAPSERENAIRETAELNERGLVKRRETIEVYDGAPAEGRVWKRRTMEWQ